MTSDAVTLSNGEKINTKTVITIAGLQASSPGEALSVERDELGRIATDDSLRVKGMSDVFAADRNRVRLDLFSAAGDTY